MKDHEAFLGFIEADVAQTSGFFLRQVFAVKYLLGDLVADLIGPGGFAEGGAGGRR